MTWMLDKQICYVSTASTQIAVPVVRVVTIFVLTAQNTAVEVVQIAGFHLLRVARNQH